MAFATSCHARLYLLGFGDFPAARPLVDRLLSIAGKPTGGTPPFLVEMQDKLCLDLDHTVLSRWEALCHRQPKHPESAEILAWVNITRGKISQLLKVRFPITSPHSHLSCPDVQKPPRKRKYEGEKVSDIKKTRRGA